MTEKFSYLLLSRFDPDLTGGTEFLTSLDEYLKYRKSQGEKVTAESWLIRDKFAAFSRKTNRPMPPSGESIRKQMSFLLKKAGLPLEVIQP